MAVDPLDYDVGELRALAGAEMDEVAEDGLSDLDGSTEVSPPYLSSVPEAGEEVVYRWLDGLMDEAGFDGTVHALEYYRFSGWLSKEAHAELQGYLLGVGRREGDGFEALDATAHMESLGYIAYLSTL